MKRTLTEALTPSKRLTKEELRTLTLALATTRLGPPVPKSDCIFAKMSSLIEEVEAWRALEPTLDRLTEIGADVARIRRTK